MSELSGFFGEWWEEMWQGMPEFVQEAQQPLHTIHANFRNAADVEAFEKLIGGPIQTSKWTWYPQKEYVRWRDSIYVCDPPLLPKYPVYIISKGRWESRVTARSLDALSVPYTIVVEPQEFDHYAAVIDPAKILMTPFSNLGQGSIPARNFVWEHAIKTGASRHWILDDNIQGFYRLNRNSKIQTTSGNMLRAAEDFVDRYENVAMAGF